MVGGGILTPELWFTAQEQGTPSTMGKTVTRGLRFSKLNWVQMLLQDYTKEIKDRDKLSDYISLTTKHKSNAFLVRFEVFTAVIM
jgi:predicted 2-oxoglutarate/Fe(II)-dependent dioxygenase YbiX